jgi:hypothetical protein
MANFNKAPYYDDFDENKKFLQVLFQPGRPVQARELTQLQTILQNQIEHGANHIFKQGSKIFDAEITGSQQAYDPVGVRFIKINPNDKDGNIVDVSNFVGKKIKRADVTEGTEFATVLAATANTAGEPATLFVKWNENVPTNIQGNSLLRTFDPTGAVTSFYTANVSSVESTKMGHCSVYSTTEGIYYVNGRYVRAPAQTVVVGKYTSNVTYQVGFNVVEEFVTSSEDSSLLDPASGFSNYAGAGADRLKVDLVLTTRGDGNNISKFTVSNSLSTLSGHLQNPESSSTFIHIATVVDGQISKKAEVPLYSEIERALARARYDQSGHFTVKEHLYILGENAPQGIGIPGGSDSFNFGVDGGKSYIHGFEYDNTNTIDWNVIPKARTVETVSNQRVPIFYGNYITVHDVQNNTSGGVNTAILPAKGYFDTRLQDRVSLFSQDAFITDSNLGANTPGSTLAANAYNSILVGTARAEAFSYDSEASKSANNQGYQGRSYRLFLRDFKPNHIDGTSNGVNRIDILDQYHVMDDLGSTTYYKLNTGSGYVHGFSNTSDTSVDDFSSGADHVSIQGYDAQGYWNIDNGVVVNAAAEWIGVQSIVLNSLNNASAPVPVGNTGILTRTTRAGFSPRQTILLDENSRALWSDAYNGAYITLTAGPGAGDRRRIVDYIGGSSANQVHEIQAAGDTARISSSDLGGTGKRGLLLVDREFSAVPTRETQYRINFGIKDARSVGINANTTVNGFATADIRHLREMDNLKGTVTAIQTSAMATPEFTAMWNIDAVDGISPKGSLGELNSGDGTYRGKRIEGDARMGGSVALLGATARMAVQTLQPNETYSNTHFTTKKEYITETMTPGSVHSIDITSGTDLYTHGQRFFPYNPTGTHELTEKERNIFVHVVHRPSGRVVDFSAGSGGKIDIIDTPGVVSRLAITVPTNDGFTGADYDVTATVVHENVRPKMKTLVRANTLGLASGVTGATGYNLSNGQVMIIDSAAEGGNNAITTFRALQPDGKSPPGFLPITLGISDAHRVRIIDTQDRAAAVTDEMIQALANNNITAFHETGANNVTDNFIFDNGQKDHIYDHAILRLKPDAPVPLGRCLALVDYFSHPASITDGSAPSYFAVDSYQYTEDLTISGVTGTFTPGDIITGNVSGVSGKVYGTKQDGTLQVVDLVASNRANGLSTGLSEGEANLHFVATDHITHTNVITSTLDSKSATVDSVMELQIAYTSIPEHSGLSRNYSLRDVADYRPRRQDGDVWNANTTVENVVLPLSCDTFNIDHYPAAQPMYTMNAYMGRIDSIYIDKFRKVRRKAGIPATYPVPPVVKESDGMSVFQVMLPPYTFSHSHVLVRPIKNRRYTVKDIGKIDDRVKLLEYYVALNSLERAAKDEAVLDSQGLSRFKNGILTDNFNEFRTVRRKIGETFEQVGHSWPPVLQSNYSLNKSKGHLRPAFTINSTAWPFSFDNSSTGISRSGANNEVITLEYESVIWTHPGAPYQPMASETSEKNEDGEFVPFGVGDGRVNINPFSMFNYNGSMSLNPNFDSFIDVIDTGEARMTNGTGLPDSVIEGMVGSGGLAGVASSSSGVATVYDNDSHNFESTLPVTENYDAFISSEGTPDLLAEPGPEAAIAAAADANPRFWNEGDTRDHFHVQASVKPQKFSVELGETFYRAFSTIDNVPQITLTKTENSIVDISVAVYMRPMDIVVSASGLKPNETLSSHFDSVTVDNYISSANKICLSGDASTLAGRCTLGRDSNGRFIQETVSINSGAGTAKLVSVRGNTAFITDIVYTSESPTLSQRFSGDNVVITGLETNETATTSQTDVGPSTYIVEDLEGYGPATPRPHGYYEHRSGYIRPLPAASGLEGITIDDGGEGQWFRLDADAPSSANALAAGQHLNGADGGFVGVEQTKIRIVRGRHAGLEGTISAYYNSSDGKLAKIDFMDSENANTFVTGTRLIGSLTSEDRDYYTIADPVTGGTEFIQTTENGEFFGKFHLPKNDAVKFKVGTKNLTLNDRGDNNPFLVTTWTSAPYFSEGSVHSQYDGILATRDVVQKQGPSGIQTGVQVPGADAAFLYGTTAAGTRGVLWATTDVHISNMGSKNGAIGSAFMVYPDGYDHRQPWWYQWGTSWTKFARGTVVGSSVDDSGNYDYIPYPVTGADGESCNGDWDKFYDSQSAASFTAAAIAQMKASRMWQFQSATASVARWYNGALLRFPSVVPMGGSIGGTRAFATVEDGAIIDITVTDHGAGIFTEGTTPKKPLWYAAYPGNGPPNSGPGRWRASTFNPNGLIASSIISHDPTEIRNSLDYVDQMMTDIENGNLTGTDLQNYSGADPLAQSFSITPAAAPHGVFITGVDLWFAAKGSSDVRVEIRKMVNGYPDQVAIPCCAGHSLAEAKLSALEIPVRNGVIEGGGADAGLPDLTDDSLSTFMFPAPVYLEPGTDYCIVVLGPTSNEFLLWTSDKRGNVLGSNELNNPTPVEVASRGKHYGGSLFLSQNAKTWEPDQYKDMMFRLRRADFTSSDGTAKFTAGSHRQGSVYDENGQRLTEPMTLALTDDFDFDYFDFAVQDRIPSSPDLAESSISYSYSAKDLDNISGVHVNFEANKRIHPANTMRLEASTGTDFKVDAKLTSIKDSRVSPVIDLSTMQLVAIQNRINSGGFSNNDLNVVREVGASFAEGDTFTIVSADPDHPVSDQGTLRVDTVTSGNKIKTMSVVNPGRNYAETPTVVKATGGGTLDNPDEFITLSGETGTTGGNAKFRYVSKPVKLKSGMDALDIKVSMDLYKPVGSEVYVYYKIKNKDDSASIDDKNWVLMNQSSPGTNMKLVPKNEWNASQTFPLVEHEYTTGSGGDVLSYEDLDGNTFVGFKFFAIKIVGFADNKAQVPVIGNLRAIAVT